MVVQLCFSGITMELSGKSLDVGQNERCASEKDERNARGTTKEERQKMRIEEVIETLRYHQKWRLGEDVEPTNPKELTKALDEAIGYIEEHEYEARRSDSRQDLMQSDS